MIVSTVGGGGWEIFSLAHTRILPFVNVPQNLSAEILLLKKQSNLIINPFHVRSLAIDRIAVALRLDEDSLSFNLVSWAVTVSVFLMFLVSCWNFNKFYAGRRYIDYDDDDDDDDGDDDWENDGDYDEEDLSDEESTVDYDDEE